MRSKRIKDILCSHRTLAGTSAPKAALPEDETQRYDADAAAANVVEKANKFEKVGRQFPDSQPRTREEERELMGSPEYPSEVCVCVCGLKL